MRHQLSAIHINKSARNIQNTDNSKQVLTYLVSCTDHALADVMLPDKEKATMTMHMLHLQQSHKPSQFDSVAAFCSDGSCVKPDKEKATITMHMLHLQQSHKPSQLNSVAAFCSDGSCVNDNPALARAGNHIARLDH